MFSNFYVVKNTSIFFLTLRKYRKSSGHRKNLEHSQIQKKIKANMTKLQLFSKCQVFTWTGLLCNITVFQAMPWFIIHTRVRV